MLIEAKYRFSSKGQWARTLRNIARDFMLPDYKIDEIIHDTEMELRTKDQETLYRYAHRKMMKLI